MKAELKASDLRIGNIFIEKHSEQIIEVIELTEKSITFTGKFPYEWQYEPLPLSEEWLLKFGFDNLGECGFGIGYFHIVNRLGKWAFPINDKLVWIESVHQLQNLYFALTGNDLTLKD